MKAHTAAKNRGVFQPGNYICRIKWLCFLDSLNHKSIIVLLRDLVKQSQRGHESMFSVPAYPVQGCPKNTHQKDVSQTSHRTTRAALWVQTLHHHGNHWATVQPSTLLNALKIFFKYSITSLDGHLGWWKTHVCNQTTELPTTDDCNQTVDGLLLRQKYTILVINRKLWF